MSTKNWERQRLNPVEWLKSHGLPHEHITYDPNMRSGEYSIIRQSGHDGTLLFSLELIAKALFPLAKQTSYYKQREADKRAAARTSYVVGPLRIAAVYGKVDLPCGRFDGMRERVRIPVRAVYHKDSA